MSGRRRCDSCILLVMKIRNPVVVGAVCVVGLLTFALVWPFTRGLKKTPDNIQIMTINGKQYRLLKATTTQAQMRGLMHVRVGDARDFDGMVFLFGSRRPQTFWNMNTFMDLDVVWMNGDQVVDTSLLPSIEDTKTVVTVSSPEPVDTVVELIRRK